MVLNRLQKVLFRFKRMHLSGINDKRSLWGWLTLVYLANCG